MKIKITFKLELSKDNDIMRSDFISREIDDDDIALFLHRIESFLNEVKRVYLPEPLKYNAKHYIMGGE